MHMSNPDPFRRYGPARITLVGGSGRSGTTLLRRLLGRHADVCEVPEWRLSVDPGGLIDFHAALSSAWTPLIFDAHYRRLERLLWQVGAKSRLLRGYRRILHRVGIARRCATNFDVAYGAVDATTFCPRYPELATELLAALRILKYRGIWTGTPFLSTGELVLGLPHQDMELSELLGGFYRGVAHETLAAAGKRHYLEKNTWYPLVFDRFVQMVPEAKLVNIWRDPRDVLCSLMEQRWAPPGHLPAARYFRCIMDRWYAVRARLSASMFLDVRYEDLVTDPASTLERIAAFADLPVVPGTHELSAKAVGRWRKCLDDRQMRDILPYLAPELDDRSA
jgi:hypothetical protein